MGFERSTTEGKIVLWKACHKGLPTATTMHRCISTINPICVWWQEENEHLTHMLFFCQSSRAVWFGSRLSLRMDDIPFDFTQAL
jgi:zinc-binding in reverse transcriptase